MKAAIISDIHSNLEAFEAVLSEIELQDVEATYCLGDMIGYGPNPNECIELAREHEIQSILGNHEWAVINDDVSRFTPYAQRAILWTKNELSKKNIDYLAGLAETRTEKMSNKNVLMAHGSPRNPIWEYVRPDWPAHELDNLISPSGADHIFLGHTHKPHVYNSKDGSIINPGSVGQPRDHDRRASFAVFDSEKGTAKINKVEYDIDKTAEKIKKSGLPGILAARLFEGR